MAASGTAALSSGDWFGGADAEPPQFDLETLYQPGASPAPGSAAPASATAPSTRKNTLHTHTPSPSIAAGLDSFRTPVSPVKETPKPAAAAPAATPTPTVEKELPIRPKSPTKTTTAPPPKAATPPAAATPAPTPVATATPAVAPTPVAPSFAESILTDQLVKITTLLESQNETLAAQNAQIRELTKEVDTLKERIVDGGTAVVVGNEELEEENRRKDEIIRKLELELAEART